MLEIYGYIGSALVVISMLMTSVKKLRIINMAGSLISGTYALIIGSLPLALMNFCLIAINAYNLFKLMRMNNEYDMMSASKDDSMLRFFIDKYYDDIVKYFLDFKKEESFDKAFVVWCDGKPVGVLLGNLIGENEIDIIIDYSIPSFRDLTVSKYIYKKLPEEGINKLSFAREKSQEHADYLFRMNYVERSGRYERDI